MPDDAAVAGNAQPGASAGAAERRDVASSRPPFGRGTVAGTALGLATLVLSALVYLAAASLLAIVVVRVGADLADGIDPFSAQGARPHLFPRQLAMRELGVDILRQVAIVVLVIGVAWGRDRGAWRTTLALVRPVAPPMPGFPAHRLLLILSAWPVLHILWVNATADAFAAPFGRNVGIAPGMALGAVAAWLAHVTVLAPAAEELLMRGEIFARARGFLSPAAAIVVTALMFSLAHLSTAGFARPVSLLPLALMLGWLRWRTGRLWPCVVLHAWSNLAVLVYVLWPAGH